MITPMHKRTHTVHRSAGFTLVELLVSLGVMVIVIVGILLLFDFNSKLARAQTQQAEMQQSIRVAQHTIVRNIRMTGRGGVPVGNLPAGFAVGVRNDVGAGGGSRDIAIGHATSPQVVAGTDVLTVRGIFTNPIYQINNADPASFTLTVDGGGQITGGTLQIPNVSHTNLAQPTQGLVDTIDPPSGGDGYPEALLLVSPVDDQIFAVVEVDPVNSDVTNPLLLNVVWRWTGGDNTDAYQVLTGSAAFPANLNSVAFVGVLEEYRYYIREERAVPGNAATELRPRLSRARMFPGTEVPYLGDDDNLSVDIADNILDLQLALGVDADNDGVLVDNADENDEWLYNHEDDDDTEVKWNQATRRLFYVRLNSLARSERRDFDYVSPAIAGIEDRLYNEPLQPVNATQREQRMFRRRLLQTLVDMRNLT